MYISCVRQNLGIDDDLFIIHNYKNNVGSPSLWDRKDGIRKDYIDLLLIDCLSFAHSLVSMRSSSLVMPEWTKTKAQVIRIQCMSLKVRKEKEAKN